MSCELKEAGREIQRLKLQKGWKEFDEPMKKELAAHLSQIATCSFHAKSIIDLWMKREKWMPTPAELTELADEAPRQAVRPGACAKCGRTGYVEQWFLYTYTYHPNGALKARECELIPDDGSPFWLMYEPKIQINPKCQVIARAAGPCDCNLGQSLASGWLRYKHETRGMQP